MPSFENLSMSDIWSHIIQIGLGLQTWLCIWWWLGRLSEFLLGLSWNLIASLGSQCTMILQFFFPLVLYCSEALKFNVFCCLECVKKINCLWIYRGTFYSFLVLLFLDLIIWWLTFMQRAKYLAENFRAPCSFFGSS